MFQIPLTALEVLVTQPSSDKLIAGKFAQIMRSAQGANNQIGLTWLPAYDALVDSIVQIESVNEGQSSCRVITPLGTISIAFEGLAMRDTMAESKHQQVASFLRATLGLAYQYAACLPSVVPSLTETLLQIQESMNCQISSLLLGLLARFSEGVRQALLPHASELIAKLEEVSFIIVALHILMSFRVWSRWMQKKSSTPFASGDMPAWIQLSVAC
jgi:hypothetical protein